MESERSIKKRLSKEAVCGAVSIEWTGEIPFDVAMSFCEEMISVFAVKPNRWSALVEGRTLTKQKEIQDRNRPDFKKTCEIYIENTHPESKYFWDFMISHVESARLQNNQVINVFQIYWNKKTYDVDINIISDALQGFVAKHAKFYYGFAFEGLYGGGIDLCGPGFAVSYSSNLKNENPFPWSSLARQNFSGSVRDRFDGLQRFPYKINYLSLAQLNKNVNETSFLQWINSLGLSSDDCFQLFVPGVWRLRVDEELFRRIVENTDSRKYFVSLE